MAKTLSETFESVDLKYMELISQIMGEGENGVSVNWNRAVQIERLALGKSSIFRNLCWELFKVCRDTGVILQYPENANGYHVAVFRPEDFKDEKIKAYTPMRFLESSLNPIPPWNTSLAKLEDAVSYMNATKRVYADYFRGENFGVISNKSRGKLVTT